MLMFSNNILMARLPCLRVLQRTITTSPNVHSKSNFKWRVLKGLSENPNSFGPLTNLPDYTFLDGRPTPLGQNLRKRLEKQRQYTESIVKLNKEVDVALSNYQKRQLEIEEKKNEVLNRKFKPKGQKKLE